MLRSRAILSESPANKSAGPSAAVWLLDSSRFGAEEFASFAQRLGTQETARYRHFVREQRRRQFLLGRMLLRFAIAKLTALPASAIAVSERHADAPQLILPHINNAMPAFSLSHSGKWIACAVSGDTLLGLDIEIVDPKRDLIGISRSVFRLEEIAWIEKQPPKSRVAAFYRLWSLREALIKLFSNAGDSGRIPDLFENGEKVVGNGSGWYSHDLHHPEFSCVLCSAKALVSPPEPVEVSPEVLSAAFDPALPERDPAG